jgi:hypothetical protein
MILYCKDSLGCTDNNNKELINNISYKLIKIFKEKKNSEYESRVEICEHWNWQILLLAFHFFLLL